MHTLNLQRGDGYKICIVLVCSCKARKILFLHCLWNKWHKAKLTLHASLSYKALLDSFSISLLGSQNFYNFSLLTAILHSLVDLFATSFSLLMLPSMTYSIHANISQSKQNQATFSITKIISWTSASLASRFGSRCRVILGSDQKITG